tara:strand:- start:25633 stop:25929 length:297 start_codon:yes stop_codon:yes gene_type:complete
MKRKKTLRTCKNGHQFYKSSECPVCPICEAENKSEKDLFSSLYAPARRALKNEGIDSLQKLSNYSEKEILQLHGIGKTAIPKLTALLKTLGLKFNGSS